MKTKVHKKLNELASTAICGNDISSSVLYVSALAIAFAGQYAWITLLIVSLVLFLFRKIYGEVVGALPLNGGAYNALLNTTSKGMASFAATLTLLSYMATAVISANEAIHYLHHLIPSMPIIISTIGLLLFFAVLTIGGITESSKVAIGIFLFHLTSLAILSAFIIYFLTTNGVQIFFQNWHFPVKGGSVVNAIFLGFAASMLGVSGFESSANFVEEQKAGVFPKTLRNMWAIVSVINPLMAVFALALFTIPLLQSNEFQNTLLIEMGNYVGGKWVAILIAVDAFLVLSGAVLTSFVGVTGLLERMTLDRIMPQFFLKKSKTGSSYRIIIMFFLLSVSVLLITNGDVKLLAGVDFNVGGGNGSDVILATGAALNDILEVTIFDTFNTSSGTFSSTTLKNNVKYQASVPTLIEDKCIKCNICVNVCPYFAITMEDKITFNHQKCFECGLCVTKCPTDALIME